MQKKKKRGLIRSSLLKIVRLFFFGLGFLFLKRKRYNVLRLDLHGKIPEDRDRSVQSFLSVGKGTLLDLLNLFRWAKGDSQIRAIFLRISHLSAGMAQIQNLKDALDDFQRSGKLTVAYMEEGGNLEYLLACGCQRIYLSPSGMLNLLGLQSEVTFLRGTLEKISVEPDFERIGKYKTAMDMFMRSNASQAHQEVMTALLDDLFDQMIETIAKARGKNAHEVRTLIDHGPYTAEEALKHGLIDGVCYEDEVEILPTKDPAVSFIPAELFWRYGRRRIFRSHPMRSLKKIAIIYGLGTIRSGHSNESPTRSMGSDSMVRCLEDARKDPDVHAVVLRVDSPGGSGLASDIIWRELIRLKKQKPVIVSMGNVAASGGYYIAMCADRILAEPGTLTGSIGVIAGKFNLKGLYETLGIHKDIYTRGEHAGLYSDYDRFSNSERAQLILQLNDFYMRFVKKASEGRGYSVEDMESKAQGRVWTGKQAKDIGLVDALGGLDAAIYQARTLANIAEHEGIEIVTLPKRRLVSRDFLAPIFHETKFPEMLEMPMNHLTLLQLFHQESVLALMPFFIQIS